VDAGPTMRVYAHWLDGEYRKALTGVDIRRPQAPEDETAERIVKTIALFGGTLVPSDAQLVDSPVLWRLFSNNGFRQFVQSDKKFLELVAHPVTRGSDYRWSITTAGLQKAIIAGRIASPMFDGNAIVSLFRDIIEAGPSVDLTALLGRRRGTLDSDALFGFTELFRYFTSASPRVAEPLIGRPSDTLYSILERALDNPFLAGEDRRQVESTVALINKRVDKDRRSRRAVIYDNLDPLVPADVDAWKLIVQAWNVAAQRTVCDTGGSIGNMRRQ
jgi:hypothetical protein